MAYRSNRFARKARPYAGALQLAKTGMKYGMKAYRTYTRYKKGKTQNQNTVTTQYDTQLQYRKRRMPRRKRVAWKRFSQKVKSVTLKSLGTYSRVFNSQCVNTVGEGSQAVLGAFLYSKAGKWTSGGVSAEAGLSDMFRIIQQESSPDDDFQYNFDSGILDLTIRNGGSNGVELDLYVVSFAEDADSLNCFQDAVITAEQETGQLNNVTKGLQLQDRGASLFDFPVLISQTKMKIWSKRKYFLGSQQTMTYQYRDAKNHVVKAINVRGGKSDATIEANGNGFIYPKLTKGVIAVFKNTPGSTGSTPLYMGVTRKYKYTQIQNHVTLDGWNNQV